MEKTRVRTRNVLNTPKKGENMAFPAPETSGHVANISYQPGIEAIITPKVPESITDPEKAEQAAKRIRASIQKQNPVLGGTVPVPPPPTVDRVADKKAFEEQQITRVEMLMLKGMVQPRLIQHTLKINDARIVQRYIIAVKHRWAISGGGTKIKEYRGELLQKINLLLNELWVQYHALSGGGDAKADVDRRGAIVCMQQIRETVKLQAEYFGVTKEQVERIVSAGSEDSPIVARIEKQTKMADMFKNFAKYSGILDGMAPAERDASLYEDDLSVQNDVGVPERLMSISPDAHDVEATED